MGRSGIWLVRRQPGESDEEAIDRSTGVSIELRDGEPWISSKENEEEEAAPDDDFVLAVAAIARSINPRLKVTEDERDDGHIKWMTLDDGDGPVFVNVFPGAVQLKAPSGWSDPPGADGMGFHALWAQATAITKRFDCVAHDPDWGDVADLSLSEEEARKAYRWL